MTAGRHDTDEPSLDRGLAVIAEHGAQRGRLGPAASVRQRGEKLRRRARITAVAGGVVAIALVAGGVALMQRPFADGAPPIVPATSAPVAPSPSVGATPSVVPKTDPSAVPGDGIPSRDLAVWLQATTTVDYPVLSVLSEQTIVAVDESTTETSALFALTPIAPGADRYLLKSARPASWGEPGCVALRGGGFSFVACDASRSDQVVTLRPTEPGFEVVVGDKAVRITGSAVSAVESGKGTSLTFIIRGTAQDPFD